MTDPGAARSARELVTPQRLREFFAPRSIALVGASDNSGWARFIVASCATAGFAGPLTAVHPRATSAFGLPVVPSLRDLGPTDLAFILAPRHAVESVLDDMGAAGVRHAVVLASGYREVGEEGRAQEDAMLARAVANGVTVLGPNCLGFVNAQARSAPYALMLPPPLIPGPVVDAVLRQLNVIRVTSLEELLTTAAALGYGRWPRGRRMGVLTLSGGSCDIIADAASARDVQLPDFSAETRAAIGAHLPPFASAHNPLDVTGFGTLANLSASTGPLTVVDHALDAAVQDPNLDFVLFAGLTLPEARPPDETTARALEARVGWLAGQMAASPIPVIMVSSTCVNVSDYGRALLTRHGLSLLGGLDLGMSALGHTLRWLENRGRIRVTPAGRTVRAGSAVAGHGSGVPWPQAPWSEVRARRLLAGAGVPMVPGGLAASAGEAVEIARKVGLPVAVKICSAQITHKSDIGGVVLGLGSAAEVRAGYEKVLAAGQAVPGAVIDGVLVTPMRTGGTELLAGVTIDPAFGPVLAVGLGGIWVEVLNDTSLRLLPADAAEVERMLGELRGLPLLQGALGDAALSLNGALRALEVNPLWVNGDQVEALDVLVVTQDAPGASGTEQVR